MKTNGFINFPKLTGTESMYVVLVVVPKEDAGNWALCRINYPVIPVDTVAGYSDLARPEIDWENAATQEAFERCTRLSHEYAYRFFPHVPFGNDRMTGSSDLSQHFLAIIHMGTADYAPGFDDGYWTATYDDLTVEGRTIWHFLKALYQDKGELVLITFIDT